MECPRSILTQFIAPSELHAHPEGYDIDIVDTYTRPIQLVVAVAKIQLGRDLVDLLHPEEAPGPELVTDRRQVIGYALIERQIRLTDAERFELVAALDVVRDRIVSHYPSVQILFARRKG